MATKTIGTGGDYSTIQLWEDSLAATLTSPEVGQLKNQTHSVSASITFSGSTTSSTNTITLECVAGGSFRDNASAGTNALRPNASNGALILASAGYLDIIQVNEAWLIIHNVQINGTGSPSRGVTCQSSGTDMVIDSCIIQSNPGGSSSVVLMYTNGVINNCVVVATGTGARGVTAGSTVSNCTIVRAAVNAAGGTGLATNYTTPLVKSTAIFGFTTVSTGTFNAGCDYNATDQSSVGTMSGTHNQLSKTFSSQFTNTGAILANADWRISSGSALKDAGVTISGISTDIIGTARPQGTNPDIGAWEIVVVAASGNPAAILMSM